MGDRAQVLIQRNDERVYLYAHWSGSDLPATVQRALKRKQRWTDLEYLARIVFCEMIKGQEAEETGFGIGTAEHGDLDHPVIVVDVDKQTVIIGSKRRTFDQFTTARLS
jgi:hypothetical protein